MLASPFCSFCKHLSSQLFNNKLCCEAFPDAIPNEILYAAQLHNEVLPNQEGEYVFTPKEGYEGYTPKIHIPAKDDDPPLVVSLSEFMKKLSESREKD